ncbi:long-chain fatty acid--CoA ligase [Natronospirillum operosum]|uniref:Long-chain-fatty-acid--CoA ligase n=1 Tax=Natronospirillum operosum TaxID=2759953 RepID=A0A4Z0W921_9GAMM|nr:AMP-binding protein [Natronospirillum operosum]TGG95109.1 long-chain fatty acid--CoA ligase [Natronospirillum operosum]
MSHDDVYDSAPWTAHYAAAHREPDAGLVKANSLPDMLTQAGQQYADHIAFTTCMPNGMSGRLSYAEVEEMSDAFAVYLREGLKLEPGARVAVQMPNCLTLPVVAFGILKAGCVLVNVNPLYTRPEMEHQFNDSGAEVLVIVNLFADKLEDILPRTPIRKVVLTHVAQWFPPVVKGVLHLVLKYWNRAIPRHSMEATGIDAALAEGRRLRDNGNIRVQDYWQGLTRDDTAVLQYTGGTTGVSKGSVLTHGNLLANLEQVDTLAGRHISPGQECILTALPMYHIFAFTVNLLAFYYSGAHNVLVPSPRPIQNCQRAFDNFPISWISGVNTLYNALLNEEWFTVYPPRHMKVALAGGTALHKAVAERWQRLVGCPISEGYGLTETSPVVCFNLIGDERPDSIGIPAPNTQVRLVDDEGATVPLGEPGEMIVKGPQVMQGYWNRPGDTEQSLKDGWFYTGDVAVMESDGHFRIVDRKKDMVLVSGFNVYPNEVEDCIARIPQVQESAVIGVPDEQSGEAVKAFVVLREEGITAEDIIRHCRNELAAYKVPKQVEFRDDLPKTPVGKVLRKELREPAPKTDA